MPAQLAARALVRREILPACLVQPGIVGVVLPVTVFADQARPADDAAATAVLPRLNEHVITVAPAARETLVARVLLVGDGLQTRDEVRRHLGFIQRDFPKDNTWMVAVAPQHAPRVIV